MQKYVKHNMKVVKFAREYLLKLVYFLLAHILASTRDFIYEDIKVKLEI